MSIKICWPERPFCHDNDLRWIEKPVVWSGPCVKFDINEIFVDRPFRTCSYCGSIHPEDLLIALNAGARLIGSDWKYGWPHKFYIRGMRSGLPADTVVKIGEKSNRVTDKNGRIIGRQITPILSTASVTRHTTGKWYNVHLKELDDLAFNLVAQTLQRHAKIKFEKINGILKYSAPYKGYQASSL